MMAPGNIEFIPNQLTWTTETPTVAGFYFYRWPTNDERRPRDIDVCSVLEYDALPPSKFQVSFDGGNRYSCVEMLAGEWAGPLEPPE